MVLSPDPNQSNLWRSGFLPGEYQGTFFDESQSEPEKIIRFLKNTQLDRTGQRRQLDLVQALNHHHEEMTGPDAFLDSRIQAMETAYRMQAEATDAFDVRKEPESVRAEYGSTPFANGCLLARRMVERGVRCVNVYYGKGQPWDDHKDIQRGLKKRCPDMDQASAALIRDLKRRGLLDETLVVWGGEFGVRPYPRTATAATTIRTATPCGWLEAARSVESSTARPTNLASRRSRIACRFTTCMRRFCISWVSITRSSRIAMPDAISA